MKKSLSMVLLVAGWLFLLPLVVQAQVGESSLAGLVTDPTGAVIAGAQVALHGVDGSTIRSVTSRQDGTYLIPTLLPGRYTLTVSAQGFATQRTQPFDLTSGQTAAINFGLTVASSSTQVTVQDVAPVLQTTSESLSATLTAGEMTSIPLLGRSFLNAISLAPGVVPVPPAGATTNHSPVSQSTIPSVFGQRQKDNNFLMDGVENRDPNLLGVAIYPPPDAIKEMTVDSGVGSSAYGHASGATIDVVTKSGTSGYHGTLWEYWRNNILDAKTYFTPSVGQYHWNQFGAEGGGPILLPWLLHRKNKWYAYGYYEGVRITSPANYLATVPTPAEVSGDFSADAPSDMTQCKTQVVQDSAGKSFCALIYNPFVTADPVTGTYTRKPFDDNKVPANMINKSAAAIANYYPKPNYSIAGQNVNWINQAGTHTNGNQWDARVDHQFGEKHSFFARYTGASNPTDSVGLPGVNGHSTDQLVNAVASDTYVPTKTLVVTARYGVTGVNYFTGNSSPAGLPQSSGLGAVFPTFLGAEILPPIGFDSYTGIPANDTTIGPVYQHSGIVDVQKLAGRHTISFGGAIVHTHEVQGSLASTSLSFMKTQTGDLIASVPTLQGTTGNAFASFLLGLPDSAARQLGGAVVDQATYGYGLYVQDTWRNGRLTLNGGLRYDYNAPPVNSYGLGTYYYEQGTYVFDQKNPITGAPATIQPGGIQPDRNNFAPRFGFAYQFTPTIVVRASAGIFYDSFGSNYIQASQSAAGNWPFSSPQSISGLNKTAVNAQLPNPFQAFGDPVGKPTTTGCSQCLNVNPATSRTPYVTEWTLSVQKQFGQSLGVEVAYFGSKGTKLTAQMIDNISPTLNNPQNVRFPGVSPYVLNGYNEYNSEYNALAVRVQRQYSHGLSYLVAYTWSKNIDQVDNLSSGNIFGTATENPTRFNGYLNRGLAGFDITHILSATGTWKIPGHTPYRVVNGVISGWELSDILTLHSGMPFSVYSSGDSENVGMIFGRQSEFPNEVGDPFKSGPVAGNSVCTAPAGPTKTAGQWFNPCAFKEPTSGTLGNVRRNPAELKSGGLVDDDMTLGKNWNIYHENTKFELRGEFFNLFNHTNLGFPGQTVTSTNFGKISTTLNSGRTVQLAAKVHF